MRTCEPSVGKKTRSTSPQIDPRTVSSGSRRHCIGAKETDITCSPTYSPKNPKTRSSPWATLRNVWLRRNNIGFHTVSRSVLLPLLSYLLVVDPKGAVLASALVEHCLHPRALLSPMDADFCAQIIKLMHCLGTPGFSTLNTYDKVRVFKQCNQHLFNFHVCAVAQ